ncbi:MAG: tRNA (guanine(26)-N(2))-dimethyltransferase [Candidatus Methanomethylophilaceae archaeon]|nr:tRNA (guanine(26)-N(2))-dimethyltransferase [Candidatus Methanomethylophilaceae archaeon]MDD3378652.1 tRNA (guanine(26)-N(2))-dimethyltransferase [Candidatus Methanomethylophilaceae archaeon]MDY0223955.1 tRNA (guanine(26)-N(2))-dimethyltransferase [Candidatus Methanomethylophilaceae archaeon]
MPAGTVIREGPTQLLVPEDHSTHGPGTKTAAVFFNEQMAFNRDVSIMFLRALERDKITVADAMTATGSRAIRIAHEVPNTIVTSNDMNSDAIPFINANIRLNDLDNCTASNENMHILFSNGAYDYVDLDPFGSPVPFIQSAIRGCRRKGILAITATDTAPLAGAHAGKCRRRYQSEPIRGYMCHEGGLRILMCTIAKELAKFDRGMKPLLSFYADHYFRTYIQVEEGADATDRSLDQLGYMHYDPATLERSTSKLSDNEHRLGPFWLGPLHNKEQLSKMTPENTAEEKRCAKMLDIWQNELNDQVFLYDLSELSSFIKLSPPRLENLIEALNQSGHATKTHISPSSFKTDLSTKEIIDIYKEISPETLRKSQ